MGAAERRRESTKQGKEQFKVRSYCLGLSQCGLAGFYLSIRKFGEERPELQCLICALEATKS